MDARMNVKSIRSASASRAATLLAVCACTPLGAAAQDQVAATALTIYSTARPGAVPADLYRPVPGQGNYAVGPAVPGYAMIRQERAVDLKQGANRLNFRDVAAYIDPTTVTFESLTSPDATRVLEQSFQFDLVSTEKLMQRYVDQVITVDQLAGDRVQAIKGRLLSTPGGLMTRPTLVWDVRAEQAGRENTRITYQTAGITWWADYNLVWTEGADENHGFLDVGAWVSILNGSGTTYPDARLKLIAGNVNRVEQPAPQSAVLRKAFDAVEANAGFAEQSFFEFHLYTLGRNTTIPDNSTLQLELFPKVRQVPAQKLLVYYGQQPGYGFPGSPAVDRNYGLPTNTKVDVYLKLENREQARLGVPLPAGRVRV